MLTKNKIVKFNLIKKILFGFNFIKGKKIDWLENKKNIVKQLNKLNENRER